MAAQNIARTSPQHGRQNIAWFVHLPKAGGSSVYSLLLSEECPVATDCRASTGPRGSFIAMPYSVGLSTPSEWTEELCTPKFFDPLRRVTTRRWTPPPGLSLELKNMSSLCDSGHWGQPSPSDLQGVHQRGVSNCPPNLHWPAHINLEIAARVRRAGAVPTVVVAVRNPLQWYPSLFFHGLRSRSRNETSTPNGDACTGDGRSPMCAVEFRHYLTKAFSEEATMLEMLRHHLGSSPPDLVPHWAWMRMETLEADLHRVMQTATGRPYPIQSKECRLPSLNKRLGGQPSCYADLYDAELTKRASSMDDWIFTRFGYERTPEGACAQGNGSIPLLEVSPKDPTVSGFPARGLTQPAVWNLLSDAFPKTVGVRNLRS